MRDFRGEANNINSLVDCLWLNSSAAADGNETLKKLWLN